MLHCPVATGVKHTMASPGVTHTLRGSLLIKVISKPTPSREDVDSVIALTYSKVLEAPQAQSMTLYLVEGNDIVFKHVHYSPTLWAAASARRPNQGHRRKTSRA